VPLVELRQVAQVVGLCVLSAPLSERCLERCLVHRPGGGRAQVRDHGLLEDVVGRRAIRFRVGVIQGRSTTESIRAMQSKGTLSSRWVRSTIAGHDIGGAIAGLSKPRDPIRPARARDCAGIDRSTPMPLGLLEARQVEDIDSVVVVGQHRYDARCTNGSGSRVLVSSGDLRQARRTQPRRRRAGRGAGDASGRVHPRSKDPRAFLTVPRDVLRRTPSHLRYRRAKPPPKIRIERAAASLIGC
jgi:hypothetical protein